MANYDALGFNAGKMQKIGASDALNIAGNILVKDNGTIGSSSATDALTVASSGNVTAAYDLIVTGDLTVNGTSSTVNVETLLVDQPQIEMGLVDGAAPSSDANLDVGMIMHYYNGSAKTAFFGWDDSASKATFIADASETNNVFSGSVGTIVANLEGDVTGNADTADAMSSAVTVSLSGDVAGSATFTSAGDTASITATIQSESVESGMLNTNVITGQTALGGAPANDDSVLLFDTSATALKEVTISELLTNAGTFSSFDLAADSGTAETVDDAETLTISGTTNQLSTVVSSTNTVTISIDNSVQFTNGSDQTLAFPAVASEQDADGSNLNLKGQRSRGAGAGGEVRLFSTDVGSTGTTENAEVKVFAATAEGAIAYQATMMDTGLNTSSGTISQHELVGVDLAKADATDSSIIGMHASFQDAGTSGPTIVLYHNKQVIKQMSGISGFSDGDQVFLANDGSLTNNSSNISTGNEIFQVGYVISASGGDFFLDIQHIMSL